MIAMNTYAIGDIHGHLDLLQQVHGWIARDIAEHGPAPIVHVGDLVDRGPNSAGVIAYLMSGIAAGQDWIVLKGNHDRMFAGYLRDFDYHDPCLRAGLGYLHPKIGGGTTLLSYGVRGATDRPLAPVYAEAVAAVPQSHRDFLESCPTSFVRDQAIFVHAGIRPGVALADQTEDDLCWIRHDFLDDPRDHGALIVHGHTAIAAPIHYGNRLNIDSSAAYGGPLTAVVVQGRAAWQITETGRVALG